MDAKTRVVVLGGGFAGLYTALNLEKQCKRDRGLEITLVSRENYFLVTPLLFEAGSGVLDPRHVVSPIRKLLDRARFVEGDIEGVDFERRVVTARQGPTTRVTEIPYDQLVIALGGVTNTRLIPGSEKGWTFKTLADAIALRNHVIDLFERADIETDPTVQADLLSFVVIGGGLVGVELMAELQQFVRYVCESYPRVPAQRLKFTLLEAMPKILPELEEDLAAYASQVLTRRGVDVRVNTKVARIEEGRLFLPGGAGEEEIRSRTIVVATGVIANPLLAKFDIRKDQRGRLDVDNTMRSKHRAEVWGIGDCASIPGPDGRPYPPLAQHALREAKMLAKNIAAVIHGGQPKPFVYSSLGTLAALGHYNGVGKVFKFKVKGILAWWVWRSYYMMQMPRWERRIRLIFDWTIALFFKYDVVKLELERQDVQRPSSQDDPSTPSHGSTPMAPSIRG
jgi:NADH:ubiquinone reductase (H+-translocating)